MPGPLTLPNKLISLTRDQVVQLYLRSYSLRNPGAKTGIGTQPYVDAQVQADAEMPILANGVTIAANVPRSTKTGDALDDEAIAMGQRTHLPAAGASGAVTISASSAGTTIFGPGTVNGQSYPGDEIRINGLRYACAVTGTYADGAQVPIYGIDVGPATNAAAGAIGTWTSPRPGCGDKATVVLQPNGGGLSGGTNAETDEEMQARLAAAAAMPPADGNLAAYLQAVLEAPLLSIEQAFAIPSVSGPGTTAILFTMRKSQPGGSRIPNATQIALVQQWLISQFPADDVIFVCAIVAQPTDVAMKVSWVAGAPAWADAIPWPPYAATQVCAKIASSPTAIAFTLSNCTTAPQVGQSIAFYDGAAQVFRKKVIGGVTSLGGNEYAITCNVTNNASDASYVPLVTGSYGQPCCPWSDSLDAIAAPTIAYFDSIGPGEQYAFFYDPGLRQKRWPPTPQQWPAEVSNRILGGLFALPAIDNVSVYAPTVPFVATVGTPSVSSNLITLRAITAFP